MTRRLALAILVIVCATLVVAGGGAYAIARSLLLADLDRAIVDRARMLPQLTGGTTRPFAAGPDDRYVVRNDLGQILQRPHEGDEEPPDRLTVVHRGFVAVADGRRLRSLTIRASIPGGPPLTVVYSSPTDRMDGVLRRLGAALIALGAVAGTVAAWVAVRVSRATLRPLHAAADVIGDIDERRLDRRIDASALPRELVPLASRLNEMLARLEQEFAAHRRFMADASHELRTPIAGLVTTLEVALRRPRGAAELSETLKGCLGDARDLHRLVEALLAQVRSESPSHEEPEEEIDAAAVLDQCASVAGALAAQRGVTVTRSYAAGLRVRTQRGRFRGIAMNLIANAVEHNRPGGTVDVFCVAGSDGVELRVSDTGPGIAAEHLPHLFEAFYRADASRGGDGAHLGLGLSLVQAHVRAMGGTVRVGSEVGAGTTFEVRLPAARNAAEPAGPAPDAAS